MLDLFQKTDSHEPIKKKWGDFDFWVVVVENTCMHFNVIISALSVSANLMCTLQSLLWLQGVYQYGCYTLLCLCVGTSCLWFFFVFKLFCVIYLTGDKKISVQTLYRTLQSQSKGLRWSEINITFRLRSFSRCCAPNKHSVILIVILKTQRKQNVHLI